MQALNGGESQVQLGVCLLLIIAGASLPHEGGQCVIMHWHVRSTLRLHVPPAVHEYDMLRHHVAAPPARCMHRDARLHSSLLTRILGPDETQEGPSQPSTWSFCTPLGLDRSAHRAWRRRRLSGERVRQRC